MNKMIKKFRSLFAAKKKCIHIAGEPKEEFMQTSMYDDGCGINETWGIRTVVRCSKCGKILIIKNRNE